MTWQGTCDLKSRSQNCRRWALTLCLACGLVSWCGSHLYAQTASTGALTGTVRDASGAVLPNASVTLRNNGTGQAFVTATNESGSYRFSLLPPGSYALNFSAVGFKTGMVPSVTVAVAEIPVRDATLQVGVKEEAITISSEAAMIQTSSSADGTLVNGSTLTALPLTTRNYTQVLSLSAGVISDVNNAANLGKGSEDVSVNGNGFNRNTYQLDGSVATNPANNQTLDGRFTGSQQAAMVVPNPDAIQEFNIQTSHYDASFGRGVGANVNVVTKSGTNDLHGALFEFLRNDIFNANDYFLKMEGQPRPAMKQNQFGGVIGGPIWKNRLFFFGSFQETRQINGLNSASLSVVSDLPPLTNDRSTAGIEAALAPVVCSKPTFAGGAQVPCNADNTQITSINPVALSLLKAKLPGGSYAVPTPQTILANGFGSSAFSVPAPFTEHQVLFNTDYVVSSRETLATRYVFERNLYEEPFCPAFPAPEINVPGYPCELSFNNNNGTLKLTSVLTNQLVNEAKGAIAIFSDWNADTYRTPASTIGMAPANILDPYAPTINIAGGIAFNASSLSDFYGRQSSIQLGDLVSWIHGRHTLRAGADFERNTFKGSSPGETRMSLEFATLQDFLLGESALQDGSPTGQSNILFLFGYYGLGPQNSVTYDFHTRDGVAFVQDDLKVNSRLTLNLGLRWEYNGQPSETRGLMGVIQPSLAERQPIPPASGTFAGLVLPHNWNPNLINPATGQPFGTPAGATINKYNSVFPDGTPLDVFSPRIGFAWQPAKTQSRFVVRGGYGWFHQVLGVHEASQPGLIGRPNVLVLLAGPANGGASLQNPFTGVAAVPSGLGFQPRTPTSNLSDSILGGAWYVPLVQQFSLNLQFAVSPRWVLEVGYVGARGTHLVGQHVINQPRLASLANPVNCGYDGNSADCITTNTVANASQRVPILGEAPGGITAVSMDGVSWYNGLQTTIRKQLSHGLTFQAAYTYSKAENDATGSLPTIHYGVGNGSNIRQANWGPADWDRTHRVIVSYIYDFPTPGNWNGITRKLLDGWSASGITTAQTGLPMTLTDPIGGSIYGFALTSSALVCPGYTVSRIKTSGGNDQARLNDWFNGAALADTPNSSCGPFPVSPAAGDGAATGYGNLGRNQVRGPGQFNWDFSLAKQTRVGGLRESAELVFRAEFYNAFNHPQFANPGTTVGSPSLGVISGTTVAPRLIQFGLKYMF
jgi:Carboxypeptidase regulatory-like domain/TonB dependent receptor